MVRRIFVQRNQKHLIDIIKKEQDRNKIEKFLDEVHSANL